MSYHRNAARRRSPAEDPDRDAFFALRTGLAARLAPQRFTFPRAYRADPVITGWLLVALLRSTGSPLNPRATRQAVAAIRATGGLPPCTACLHTGTVPDVPPGWYRCARCGSSSGWAWSEHDAELWARAAGLWPPTHPSTRPPTHPASPVRVTDSNT